MTSADVNVPSIGDTYAVPEVGQLVNVRRRQWIVADVDASSLSRERRSQSLVTLASIDEDALGLVEESFAEAESRSGQGSRKGFGKLLDVQFYSPRIRFSVRKKKIRELLRM